MLKQFKNYGTISNKIHFYGCQRDNKIRKRLAVPIRALIGNNRKVWRLNWFSFRNKSHLKSKISTQVMIFSGNKSDKSAMCGL